MLKQVAKCLSVYQLKKTNDTYMQKSLKLMSKSLLRSSPKTKCKNAFRILEWNSILAAKGEKPGGLRLVLRLLSAVLCTSSTIWG